MCPLLGGFSSFGVQLLFSCAGEQDQLGDLLTRILDDSGKTPSIPNICGQEVDLDSLDHLTLVTDLTLYIRRLTQQQQNLDSFLGI